MAYLRAGQQESAFSCIMQHLLVVPVDDDIVCAADGNGVRKETHEISLSTEGGRSSARIELQQLVEIKDYAMSVSAHYPRLRRTPTLNVMTNSLTSNDSVIIQDSNLSPAGPYTLSWKPSKVLHLAIAENLDESGTTELSNDPKLAPAAFMSPSPGRGA